MYTALNLQSLLGPPAIFLICWLLSEDRRRFPWRLAIGAMACQVALIGLLFALPASRSALHAVGSGVEGLAAASHAGTAFIFGYLAGGPPPYAAVRPENSFLFAFSVLPVILVVCSLSALLWHWRVLKWIVAVFGLVFRRTLGLRGPPALAVAATIFMGQVEGPIFIRTYLDRLSRSELFMLLSVGMSCISGSTLVAYATILRASVPNAAAHVLTASLISAPAGVLLARIIVPPGDEQTTLGAEDGETRRYGSSIDAVTRGVGDGLQIVLNVAATLIVFVALVTLTDELLSVLPPVGGAPATLERLLGWAFAPLAFCIGAPWSEAAAAGRLLGVKMVLTEFSAFIQLSQLRDGVLSPRTRLLMTYALCGFANVGSVGINVSGFSVLAPARREEVLGLIWKALAAGFLATCLTASVVGALPDALLAAR
jgi:CNT family concentrative nucleoside transporter